MSEWISVKDEPPPRMKLILFCNEHQTGAGFLLHRDTGFKLGRYISASPFVDAITYWMPLPEPTA